MHWLTFCVFSGYAPLLLSGLCMMINHAILSSNAFLLVDAISRRFHTRLVSELNGLNFLCPKLFILCLGNCLLFLGFPGSLSFVSEFLFFMFLLDFSPLLFSLLLFFLYFLSPSFFFRLWLNVLFSFPPVTRAIPADVSKIELLLLGFFIVLSFWLGLTWQIYLL
jgi:NADH-quinone oxidoreductase subunit M